MTVSKNEKTEVRCKGLFFKANSNTYWSGGRYVSQRVLRLMKRMSCANCPACEYGIELVEISAQEGDYFPVHETQMTDGDIYKLFFTEDEVRFVRVGRQNPASAQG